MKRREKDLGEKINHPQHYGGNVTHEVWRCLQAWNLHLNAYLWNTVKYISRAGKKDSQTYLEDLKKARWYLDREIERKELEDNQAIHENADHRNSKHSGRSPSGRT